MQEVRSPEKEVNERIIAPDGIIVLNTDKKIIVFNEAACRITGYEEQQILSNDINILISELKDEQSYILQSIKSEEIFTNISLTLNCANNKTLQVTASITPVVQPSHGIIGVVIVFRDTNETLTLYAELQKKNKEIIEEKNKLEAIFRSRLEGTCTIDMNGVITSFNHAAENITGYSEKDVMGKEYWEVILPGANKESSYFKSIFSEDIQTRQREFLLSRNDNSKMLVRGNSAPLIDASGYIIGAVLSFQDISELKNLSNHLEERFHFNNIIGRSKAMQDVYNLMENVIKTDSTVLITGESGTGKEMVARAIHLNSERKSEPFIVINCSAFAETLLESELFGHEKGAFTGAIRRKPGRFELAGEGSIFLDEIGDIALPVQVKLLRVLENKQFERVGGTDTLDLKARIITATHRNLEVEIAEGRFREDLFYRINVIDIHLPPLIKRYGDIPSLVHYFMLKFKKKFNKDITDISPNAMQVINNHGWPGNIRELENVIEHAFVVCSGKIIETEHLPAKLWKMIEKIMFDEKENKQKSLLGNAEKQIIKETLLKFNGNRSETARVLGIDKTTLWRKMKKFGLQ